MQPDLPWNVAGIPPEAREAARAAARREGLSVGDWLTRRILRTFAEGNESVDNLRQSWRQASQALRSSHVELREDAALRDSDEMLARVSRSETESQGAWRRIEDQLRGVSRRLDQAERSQTENNRAMSKTAAEINVAAREQAQAFDQLGGQILGVNERLARLESETASDGLKDAVRALHQGLSRLADQVSQTATQSATQVAALAGNVEQLAAKMIESRKDLDHVSRSLEKRIASAEARAHQAEVQAKRGDIEQLARTLESRVGSIENRVQDSERAARARAETLDKVVATINASEDARRGVEAELRRQVSGLQQLNDTLDQLRSRVTLDSAAAAGSMARLEQSVTKLEARNENPERRLEGIEKILSELVARLEDTERSNRGDAGSVEEGLRNLATRVDAADKLHRESIAELRVAVKEATGRFEGIDLPLVSTAAPPPLPPRPTPPQFDLPPFPDLQDIGFASQPPAFTAPLPQPDPPPAVEPDSSFSDGSFAAEPHVTNSPDVSSAASGESFLAAARRAARTTSADESGPASFGGFAWGIRSDFASESKSSIARYALIGALGLLIIAAIGAGALVAHSVLSPASKVHTPVTPANVPAAIPNAATVPSPAVGTPRASAQGSPVVPQQHTLNAGPLQPDKAPAEPARQAAQQLASANPQTTLDKLKALANSGNANAELLLGLGLLDGDGLAVNEAEAAKWLERAANQNVALAAYRLGTLYERGHGVPADPRRAAQWYATAATAGNYKAMHNLAVAYANGAGVKKDLVVAAQWFMRAANLGLADSQFNLAVLYERGMGVQQSLLDAYKWYAIAAARGDAESKARIALLATQMSAEDKAAAQRAASSFHASPLARTANEPPPISMLVRG
jgi:localization factor PodJL